MLHALVHAMAATAVPPGFTEVGNVPLLRHLANQSVELIWLPTSLILDGSPLEVGGNITVAGAPGASLDAGGLSRVIILHDEAALTVRGIDLLNGISPVGGDGGCLLLGINTALLLDRSTLSACSATRGGSIFAKSRSVVEMRATTIRNATARAPAGPPTRAHGGAVYVASSAHMVMSEGSLIEDVLVISDGDAAFGGGVYLGGTLEIIDSSITDATAQSEAWLAYGAGVSMANALQYTPL